MRQLNLKAWLVALLIALVPCTATAVGLGRLSMLSALGDRLNLEIDLVSVSKEELATLGARLSGAEAYKQANLQYNAALVGARITIERRQSGQPYVKITSIRPVNEPFIDLLVEITSSSGRLVREYTVLVDPPGSPLAQQPAPGAAAPSPAPATVPPVAAPAPPTRRPPAAAAAPAPMAGAKEYGPIKKGETLSSIAKSVAPEGVNLEQVMLGLYRSNPDAFINKNLNLVRTGRILRVPEKDEIAAIPAAEARKEFRAQVADWNSYRQNLAGSPVGARAEGGSTATGRITTKVEDKAGGAPKDVVRLSRGEPAGAGKAKGAAGASADRLRALEEEVQAREKALAEANERISQLEKTVKDMQKLVEMKSPGMAAAQQKAEEAGKAKAEAKAAPRPEAKAEAPKAEAKAEAPKPEPAPAQKPEVVAIKPDAEKAPARDAEKAPPPADAKAEAKAEAPKAEKAAATEEPKPKPKPKVVPPPPPPPPSMMDQIIEAATDPLYLGAGGGLIVLGGLAFWMARRRRTAGAEALEPRRAAPVLPKMPAAAGPDTTMTMPASAIAAATAAPAPAPAAAIDEVDPLAEAEVYIAYGRDAQAEEILKEALAKNPQREDAQLKLLEIYSGRKDKDAFNSLAARLNKQTGGSGENWLAAAAMGYALDPTNPLYEAGQHAASAAPAAGTASDLDFDLGGESSSVATDITLDSGAVAAATTGIAHDTTAVLDAGELSSMAAEGQKEAESPAPLVPDFSLDIPAAGEQDATVTQTDIALDAPVPTQDGHVIDFQIEVPKVDAPETISPAPAEAPVTDAGLDFKLDIPDLDLGEKTAAEPAVGGEKDGHWYDVQTKFDLAKAYQEMGDKDGAKEILQEVLNEGDSDQQSQAKKLLESIV